MAAIKPTPPPVKKVPPPMLPTADAAEQLYDQAIAAQNNKDYQKAFTLFQAYVNKFPDHKWVGNAQSRMAWLSKTIKRDQNPDQPIARDQQSRPGDTTAEVKNQKAQLAEKMYVRALTAFYHKNYDNALPLFVSISQNYPSVDIADNAVYWSGECHYAQDNYYDAILAFKKVVKNYPRGNKTADALLKTGYSYLALGDPKNASYFFKQVISKHPQSSAAVKAKKKLQRYSKGSDSGDSQRKKQKSLQVNRDSNTKISLADASGRIQ
jgi:tol-pal system protein YbgF